MQVLHIPSNICQVPLKFIIKRTSLMVQFLRLHLPMQGTWVQSLVGELRSSIAVGNANWYSHFGKKTVWQFLTCMHAKSLQSCLTLCDPMDCSLPGSSVHGIFQARVLKWCAISFSRGSPLLTLARGYVFCPL